MCRTKPLTANIVSYNAQNGISKKPDDKFTLKSGVYSRFDVELEKIRLSPPNVDRIRDRNIVTK